MSKRLELIIKHIGTWVALLLIPHVFIAVPFQLNVLCYEIVILIPSLVIFYVHAGFSVPFFYINRKYGYYFMTVVALIVIFQLLTHLLSPFHVQYFDLLQELDFQPKGHHHAQAPGPTHRYVSFFLTLAASGMYSYSIENAKRERKIREMEKQQFESNLRLLKSQLSPHFLFNALNSVYSLSLKKSDDLPKAILTISDLLRYVTYDSSGNTVNIQKEINYLKDYIKLQQLRLSPDSKIEFDVQNENESAEIAPMILIPFVENAFKHGINADNVVNIKSVISITESEVDFDIENTKVVENQKDGTHGIGIQNVISRLDILYGSKYNLEISDTDETYKVTLKLKL